MKYRITSEPVHCQVEPFENVGDPKVGDVIEVTSEEPDSDGDVFFAPEVNGRDHIALRCLTPVTEAGEVTVKVTPDLDDFAALLVEQIAKSLEEAAKAIRGAAS